MLSNRQAAMEYIGLGLDAIPLQFLSKVALLKDWQKLSPQQQWERASGEVNVGIRTGGDLRVCVLDSDDKKLPTWNAVQNFLWGLGIEPNSYPVVSTPNGGYHAYLTLEDRLDGNCRLFKPDFGSGEARFGSGSYVVAPPSVLPNGAYQLKAGDLGKLPRIMARDLREILNISIEKTVRETSQKNHLSKFAMNLLNGRIPEKYRSRSEAEQAILTNLAYYGYDFDDVKTIFQTYPAAGKYQKLREKNPVAADHWLGNSYEKAIHFVETSQASTRAQLIALYRWALNQPWPGRTGSSDRSVFLTHLSISYETSKLIYSASSRFIAERAGLNRATAERATRRLHQRGLITLEEKADEDRANFYQLTLQDESILSQSYESMDTICNIVGHDVFRRSGLGKPAAEIYGLLLISPRKVTDLVRSSGRHRSTIWRKLNQMLSIVDPSTGELIPMVAKEGKLWRALPVDLDRLAQILGTAGALEKQKQQHARERARHRRSLEFGRLNNSTKPPDSSWH